MADKLVLSLNILADALSLLHDAWEDDNADLLAHYPFDRDLLEVLHNVIDWRDAVVGDPARQHPIERFKVQRAAGSEDPIPLVGRFYAFADGEARWLTPYSVLAAANDAETMAIIAALKPGERHVFKTDTETLSVERTTVDFNRKMLNFPPGATQ